MGTCLKCQDIGVPIVAATMDQPARGLCERCLYSEQSHTFSENKRLVEDAELPGTHKADRKLHEPLREPEYIAECYCVNCQSKRLHPDRYRYVTEAELRSGRREQDQLYAKIHDLDRAPDTYQGWYDRWLIDGPDKDGSSYALDRMRDYVTENTPDSVKEAEPEPVQNGFRKRISACGSAGTVLVNLLMMAFAIAVGSAAGILVTGIFTLLSLVVLGL